MSFANITKCFERMAVANKLRKGLFHGKELQFGHNVSFSNNKCVNFCASRLYSSPSLQNRATDFGLRQYEHEYKQQNTSSPVCCACEDFWGWGYLQYSCHFAIILSRYIEDTHMAYRIWIHPLIQVFMDIFCAVLAAVWLIMCCFLPNRLEPLADGKSILKTNVYIAKP